MRKEKVLRFVGVLLFAWGLGIVLNLVREIPFDVLDMKYLLLVMLMLVLLLAGGTMLHIAKKMKSQSSHIETDEMFKKVGYTALAASLQVLLILVPIVLCLDSFFHFLDKVGAEDILSIFWFGASFLVLIFAGWYSHHPDKTGL